MALFKKQNENNVFLLYNKLIINHDVVFLILIYFCKLAPIQTYLERETFNWGHASIWLASKHVCGGVFLIAAWCRRTQSSVGGTAPGQVALGCIGKAVEQARSIASLHRSSSICLPQFMPSLPSVMGTRETLDIINPFLPKLLLILMFSTATIQYAILMIWSLMALNEVIMYYHHHHPPNSSSCKLNSAALDQWLPTQLLQEWCALSSKW